MTYKFNEYSYFLGLTIYIHIEEKKKEKKGIKNREKVAK